MFRNGRALLLFTLACDAKDQTLADAGSPPDTGVTPPGKDAGPDDTGMPPGFGESEKANLRFKEVIRLTNDFGQALGLPAAEVCLELGQYDCRAVHAITLGGVEPYELGLFDPLSTTVTTPIAVERLATHACERRVTRDLGSAGAVVFQGLADGALADADEPKVSAAITSLYRGAAQRDATASEIEHLEQLYRDIAATGIDNPTRQWAIASCVAVLTSVETLFY